MLKFIKLFLIVAFLATSALAEEPSINGKLQADSTFQIEGLAIRGYDPVAYFTQGKPVKGSSEFQHKWMGATWLFASAENKDTFVKDPERYAPQFGGYCAFGMSHGYAAPIDPQAWTIVKDKLYLNYSPDVRREWSKQISKHIAQAKENWPKIPKKPLAE